MFVYGLSITCKTVSLPLQLLVELGQQDVCQQWREWPTLWCAHFAGFNVLSNQHPGAQVAPDELQQSFVGNGGTGFQIRCPVSYTHLTLPTSDLV